MRLAAPLASPYYEGTLGTSDLVPSQFDFALDGRVFMYDEKYMGASPQMARESVPLYKPQSDQGGQVSEASLNPEDLARAAGESWHRGAGQRFFDRPGSDPYRFRASKGVDCWTRDQLTLLKDTALFAASAATNLRVAPTSTRLFWLDGTNVKYDDDLTGASSSMTGSPGNAWLSITSNGYDVWACDGASIYHWIRTATAVGAAYGTADVDLLVWVRDKGRLMGAHDSDVYNITSGAASYTDIGPATVSTDFRWVGFAGGPSCIYGAGFEGDKSNIYRWGIKADGTGLDAAVPALVDGLPDGEIVRSIFSYSGVVVIGTDNGFRFARPVNDAGDLIVGDLVDLGVAVRCFEGQGRHIWGGWSNYDDVSSGLVRIDPTQLTDDAAERVPAYASDLMATAQGDVLDVCTFLGRRVFAVSGSGIWVEHATDLVAEGTLLTGLITHGLPDAKVGMYVIVNHDELQGSIAAAVSADGGALVSVGASSVEGETARVLNAGEARGETAELEFTLGRSSGDATEGPAQTRWTYEANPAPGRGAIFWVFLKLFDTVKDRANNNFSMDTKAAYTALEAMVNDGAPHTAQDAGGSVTVFVDDFRFYQEKATATFYDGTFAAKLRRPRRRV